LSVLVAIGLFVSSFKGEIFSAGMLLILSTVIVKANIFNKISNLAPRVKVGMFYVLVQNFLKRWF
jgi:hypothetical protein